MRLAHTFLLLVFFISTGGRGGACSHMVEADFVCFDSAIKLYRMTTGTLPPSDTGLDALVERPVSLLLDGPWEKIMTKIPKDPWGRPYSFILDSDLPGGYGIFSRGPDGISRSVGNDADDFNSWSPSSRGIETNPMKSMPWFLPGFVLSSILLFYLGVRVESYWNRAQKDAP